MNSSIANVNESSSCFELDEKEEAFYIKWISLLEGIGIITLNFILITLLCKQKKPSRMAFFVLHLAIADLSVGLMYVLPECIFDRFLSNWEKYSCLVLFGYCANLTIYASTFLIVVLTVDRLFVIIRPLSASTKGKKYRYGLISIAWLLAILLALPYAFHINFVCTTQGYVCVHIFDNIEAIVLAELFINVLIPVSIIIFCYGWIILTICRRESIGGFGRRTQTSTVRYSNGSATLLHNVQKSQSESIINSAKKKTIKVLLVVVVVYILSWAPINTAQILNTFEILDASSAYKFLHVLSPINSLMNPIVFLYFNRQMVSTEKRKNSFFTSHAHTECDRLT